MSNNTITTSCQDDILDDVLTTTIGGTGASGSGYVTISGAGASGSSYSWNGAGASTWNTTYSITGGTTIAGNLGIGTSPWNGTYTNGTVSVSKPKLTLDVEGDTPVITTEKNRIDVDELADMIKFMKSLLVAVASDEEFAKRNPALADAAHDMLINKLKG